MDEDQLTVVFVPRYFALQRELKRGSAKSTTRACQQLKRLSSLLPQLAKGRAVVATAANLQALGQDPEPRLAAQLDVACRALEALLQ